MYKDKTGSNNPMFGKPKSEETLAKMRKKYTFMTVINNLLGVMLA